MPKDLHDLCVARERISRLGGGGSEKGDNIARIHLRDHAAAVEIFKLTPLVTLWKLIPTSTAADGGINSFDAIKQFHLKY
jgi:hypothetical protein